MTESPSTSIPDEVLMNKIYLVRGYKIMLDRDLAALYDVKPIRLREQVKRNPGRFPANFMFQLDDDEADLMVSQNAIPSKKSMGGSLPYAFTEHGILMLSNVLKSERAIQMSIRIIEIFVRLRELVLQHKDIALLVEQVEKRFMEHDQKFATLFQFLGRFMEASEPTKVSGFMIGKNKP